MAYAAPKVGSENRVIVPSPPSGSDASDRGVIRSDIREPTIKVVSNEYRSEKSAHEREPKQALQQMAWDVQQIACGEIHLLSSTAGDARRVANGKHARYRLVKSGMPGHGMILHYAQLHAVEIPGLLGRRGAPYQPSAALQAKIMRCQRNIFDALLIGDIKHVFSEGLDQTLVPDEFEAGSELARYRDQIRIRFRGYQPGGAMTPSQGEIFYACGALVYGHFARGVTLHPTTNPAHVAKQDAYYADQVNRDQIVANNFTPPQADHSLFFDGAEQAARTEIKRVMQGKSLKVALIFGRAHQPESFTRNFDEKDFSPVVYFKDMTE